MKHERDGSDTEIHQVLHYDVAGVLRSRESGFDHCETALHKEHERRAHHKPNASAAATYIGQHSIVIHSRISSINLLQK